MATLAAVPFHVVHGSMKTLGQPIVQLPLCIREVNVANPGLLEPEFTAPTDDLILERGHIGIAVLVRVACQCTFPEEVPEAALV